MSWTLADFLSRSTAGMVNRGEMTLSAASFWINEAQRHVWEMLPHALHERIAVSSTTVNENRISLPTDFDAMIGVSNLSATPARPLEAINARQADSWSATTATPTHYMQYADWLELYPKPDSAYSLQLRYYAQPSDMTATTTAPSVGTRYHRAVFLRAKQYIAEELRDFEAAGQAAAMFRDEMAVPSDWDKRRKANRMLGLALPRAYNDVPVAQPSTDFDHSDA